MKTFLAAILLLAACVGTRGADSSASGSAPVEGLIFYQDFDHQGVALCGDGWAWKQDVPADRLVPGRFGKACRFERPRTNFLSANQASAETNVEGFQAGPGVALTSVTRETAFGKQVLRAQGGAAGLMWQTTPVLLSTQAPHRPNKVFVFSAYLRAERPGVRVRLTLNDEKEKGNWRAEIAASDEKAQAKATSKTAAKAPLETVTAPATVTLTTSWQRIAARLEIDSRRPTQALVGTLELLDPPSGAILADGLQLEQACVYPLTNTDPASWIPGGATSEHAWIDMPVRHTGFNGSRGTLACWIRPMPDQCGGTRDVGAALTIGNSWWSPVWQVGGATWYAGEAPTKQPKGKIPGGAAQKRLLEPGSHDGWHHLLLAWDDGEAAGYLDGQPFGKTPLAGGEPVPAAILRLGGSFLEGVPMTGDLDEVALYSRRLSDDEIRRLAEAPDALTRQLPTVLVQRPLRTEFLRSESQAQIPLDLVSYGESSLEATLAASVSELGGSVKQTWSPGKPVHLAIKPWLSEPGRCRLTVEAAAGNRTVRASDWLEVFEQPPSPEFIIYAWGGTDPDLEQRGFNCLFGEPSNLLRRGMWAIARIDVREGVPHPWSPETRVRARPIAERTARAAMSHPNVRACLVNSEAFHPPFPADQPWFLDWLKTETGLEGIPPEIKRPPLHVRAKADSDVPPVIPEDFPSYKFLRWWTERGQGYYLLNNQMVDWMRHAGLKTIYYGDQPETAAQFKAMDLVDFWGYPKSPEGLVARFSHASCFARLAGKPFQAMPGTVYWDDGNGLWLKDADGKRKVLCLSPDCLKENLWISVACPTESIGLYGLGERHTELYDKACDAAMTEAYRLISPVGVLVGGLPTEQAKVALLETDGLDYTQPGVQDNYVRHWLTRTASRVLARARLPYDWITDEHVHAGWLQRYQAVVVPGAWALPAATHRALVAYAQSGGQVIADRVMRAEIPNVRRLAIDTQAYPDEAADRELGGWARAARDKLPGWATVTPAEAVFTYTREAGDARYILVVNDRRQSGPQYEKWRVMLNAIGRKPHEPLRDQGLAQDVQVTVPAGSVLYDVLKHRRLEAALVGVQQRASLTLEPGGAAVIAAFPRVLKQLTLTAPSRLARGSEATVALQVLDDSGRPAPGRQLAEIRVTRPDGQPWSGQQRYRRIVDGRLSMPLRLPRSAQQGDWRIGVLEWTSGLRAVATVSVE